MVVAGDHPLLTASMEQLLITVAVIVVGVGMIAAGVFTLIHWSRRRTERSTPLMAAQIRCAAWIVCLVVACISFVISLYFVLTAQRTTGTVIAFDEKFDNQYGAKTFAPIIQFYDVSGGEHSVSSGIYQSPSPFSVGESVSILFRSNQPARARIDRFWDLWAVPTVSIALAGFFFVLHSMTRNGRLIQLKLFKFIRLNLKKGC